MATLPSEKSAKAGVQPESDSSQSIKHGQILDADDDLLQQIGYKQVA